jgi:putative transposase
MAHTYVSALVHVVFSTKGRRKTISAQLQPKLWAYLSGIAWRNGMTAVQVGGIADHIHVLLILPAIMPIAKAVQLLKGGSSKWIHDTEGKPFAWQDGYGAFTVGISQLQTTIAYIRNQEQHHRKRTFEEEFLAFLKKHDIQYDPRFVWG